MDGQTDGRTDVFVIAYSALSMLSRAKNTAMSASFSQLYSLQTALILPGIIFPGNSIVVMAVNNPLDWLPSISSHIVRKL